MSSTCSSSAAASTAPWRPWPSPPTAPRSPWSTATTSARGRARSRRTWCGAASSTSSSTRSGSSSGSAGRATGWLTAYPSRIAETRFLAALDRSSTHHPWFAAPRAHPPTGDSGSFHTRAPRLRSRQGDRRPRAGRRHQQRPRWHRVLRLPVARERLPLRQRVGLRRRRARRGDRQLRRRDECRARRRSMAGRPASTADRHDVLETTARAIVNAAGPRVGEINAMTDTADPPPARVLQGHPPRRPVDHRLGPGARLLRRRGPAVLRDPDGPSVGDRHDRHPRRRPRRRRSPQDDRDFVLDQVNKRLSLERPIARRRTSSPTAAGFAASSSATTMSVDRDWTELSRRHAVEVDRGRAVVTVLGGKLTDCLNVGIEVVDAVRDCGVTIVGRPSQVVRRARSHRTRPLPAAGRSRRAATGPPNANRRRRSPTCSGGAMAAGPMRSWRGSKPIRSSGAADDVGRRLLPGRDRGRRRGGVDRHDGRLPAPTHPARSARTARRTCAPIRASSRPAASCCPNDAAAAWSGGQADLTTKSNP